MNMIKQSNYTSLSYVGLLGNKELEEILVEVKEYIDANIIDLKIKRRVYIVIVEALENIQRHVDAEIVKIISPKFTIDINKDNCILNFINVICCKNSEELKTILFKLKDKSKGEIKELYKATITKAEISSKGGAGLGLLEIAKVSNNNIKYEFNAIDKDICEFILEVKFDL